MTDRPPILTAMFDLLPPAGSSWDPFDRQRWMSALEAVLELAYPRASAPAVAAVEAAGTRPKPEPSTVRLEVNEEAGTFTVERKLIVCPQCDQKFRSRQALASHMRSHRYECDVCQARFGSERALGNHRARNHPSAPERGNAPFPPVVELVPDAEPQLQPEPEPEPEVVVETPPAPAPAPAAAAGPAPIDPGFWRPQAPPRPIAEPIARVPVADVDAARARAAAAI